MSKRVRCAIYTRKSTDEGLDQAFNLNGQKAVYVALGDDRVSPSLVERVSKARVAIAVRR